MASPLPASFGAAISSMVRHFSAETRSTILALGSWLLLCILDLATRTDTTQPAVRWSQTTALVTLGVAVLVAVAGQLCQLRDVRSLRPTPLTAVVTENGKQLTRRRLQRFKVVCCHATHSVLLMGAIVWVILNAVWRHPEVWFGVTTLYSLLGWLMLLAVDSGTAAPEGSHRKLEMEQLEGGLSAGKLVEERSPQAADEGQWNPLFPSQAPASAVRCSCGRQVGVSTGVPVHHLDQSLQQLLQAIPRSSNSAAAPISPEEAQRAAAATVAALAARQQLQRLEATGGSRQRQHLQDWAGGDSGSVSSNGSHPRPEDRSPEDEHGRVRPQRAPGRARPAGEPGVEGEMNSAMADNPSQAQPGRRLSQASAGSSGSAGSAFSDVSA